MDKITKVNVEGGEYGFVAGQTIKGVSGALSSDYVKHVILPEGAEVVEGMLVAVTFVNENTAGYAGEKTVWSTNGINFYWDSGYTQLITLPPQGCYTVTATETQYEYTLSEYPVLVMGDMTKPFCNSRGHPAGGKLWGAEDTVTVINLENRFIALQTTVNELIPGSALPVTSGAVATKLQEYQTVDFMNHFLIKRVDWVLRDNGTNTFNIANSEMYLFMNVHALCRPAQVCLVRLYNNVLNVNVIISGGAPVEITHVSGTTVQFKATGNCRGYLWRFNGISAT